MPRKANPTARGTLNPKIYNTALKKFQPIYNKKGEVKPIISKRLKENSKAYQVPPDFIFDKKNKALVPIKIRGTNIKTKEFKSIARTRPKTIQFNKSQIYDFSNNKIMERKEVLTKGRKKKAGYKNYKVEGSIILKESPYITDQILKPSKQSIYNGLIRKKRYIVEDTDFITIGDEYDNWGAVTPEEKSQLLEERLSDFVETIKFSYINDFSTELREKADFSRVILRFKGLGDELRYFNINELSDLKYLIDNYKTGSWGSDTEGGGVSMENLDFTFFEINLKGAGLIQGGGTAKVESKYWYCNQPRTDFNCCLDGAINKGLKLKKTYKTIRKRMMGLYPENIEWGKMISFDQLDLYEDTFEVNINVYEDTTHYDNDNCIRQSPKTYENEVKLLFKEEHFALIEKPKFKINELSGEQKRRFGLYKKRKDNIITSIKNKENKIKKKAKKEILVIFDIETVFDIYDNNLLKPYGISWVVWDKEKEFKYNEEVHLNEPHCYYEKGDKCLRKFIKFLINPPDDIIYRPIGFNNSRFDNFALCSEARYMNVLNNVFMADGSILYCSITGCKNTWDASRFLTGQSLEMACNSYKTNPRKRKDLIDHYEIQCFFERNGWSGLNHLLDNKEELVVYNKIDCLCLLDLVLKLRSAYLHLFNEDVFDYLTISSMGYKIQVKKWQGNEDKIENIKNDKNIDIKLKAEMIREIKPKFNIVKPKSYEEDLFFRKSLTAGRTQSFYGKMDYKGEIAMGDIKSLYPTVMGNYDNHCPYPYGDYHYTDKFMKDKLGIYNVNIKHQRCQWKNKEVIYSQFKKVQEITGIDLYREFAPNVIPKRSPDEPLDWFIKGEINNINLTSVDIEVLKWATEDDDCIEIIDGYYWDESRTDLFIDFLDPPRIEKTKQDRLKEEKSPDYNVALREGCKGISNCLSGKLLEAIHEDVSGVFNSKTYFKYRDDEDISQVDIQDFGGGLSFVVGKRTAEKSFENLNYDKRKPSYLGMFVYSYARKLMYQKLLSKYIGLYMDTDSLAMPMIEWDRLNKDYEGKNFVDTGEYGCIEEEVCCKDEKGNFKPATRLIAISPKNYCVINEYNESYSKRKFKGVRKTDYFLPLNEFGLYTTDKNNVVDVKSPAYINIRSMKQEEIRKIREFKCCTKCINKVMKDKNNRCSRCKNQESKMKKAYSTEMFEYLVRGEKIAVFCSMINKIKYTLGNEEAEWKYAKKTGYGASVEEMEHIMKSNSEEKQTIQMSFDKENNLIGSRELKNVFNLKQTYLVKII